MGYTRDKLRDAPRHREAPVQRCLPCHRTRFVYNDSQEATDWEEMPISLQHDWFRCSDVSVTGTYCDECTVYYHQLMTYGKSNPAREESIRDGCFPT
jgi:hypothetical protein